jgi:uncharacterized protein (DUF433 family)
MLLTPTAETIPLTTDRHQVIRVGQTRVTLQTVIAAFWEGATAEEIAQQYPALELADIYAVLAYYLRHRPAVDAYLQQMSAHAQTVKQKNETNFNPVGLRERLLARQVQPTK